MKKYVALLAVMLFAFNVQAAEISAENLSLTQEQNQKLTELQAKLKAEVDPILEEMESSRNRITEIEKKYFGEFWNLLTDEQRKKFSELKK